MLNLHSATAKVLKYGKSLLKMVYNFSLTFFLRFLENVKLMPPKLFNICLLKKNTEYTSSSHFLFHHVWMISKVVKDLWHILLENRSLHSIMGCLFLQKLQCNTSRILWYASQTITNIQKIWKKQILFSRTVHSGIV